MTLIIAREDCLAWLDGSTRRWRRDGARPDSSCHVWNTPTREPRASIIAWLPFYGAGKRAAKLERCSHDEPTNGRGTLQPRRCTTSTRTSLGKLAKNGQRRPDRECPAQVATYSFVPQVQDRARDANLAQRRSGALRLMLGNVVSRRAARAAQPPRKRPRGSIPGSIGLAHELEPLKVQRQTPPRTASLRRGFRAGAACMTAEVHVLTQPKRRDNLVSLLRQRE